jgi:hypothetical protein
MSSLLQWTYPFLWVPELSLPSASTSNSSQLNHSSSLTDCKLMVKLMLKLIYGWWSVCLSWCRAHIWSPWPDFCFLFDNCGFLDVGRPLWWEEGSVIYLAQLCPRALGYLLVTSYNSQGGGILIRLHIVWLQVQVQATLQPTVSRPVHLDVGPPLGPAHDQILIFCLTTSFFFKKGTLSDEKMGL